MNLPELPEPFDHGKASKECECGTWWTVGKCPICKPSDFYSPAQVHTYGQACAQAAREQAATIAESWAEPSTLRLHAGEMTAQEMRTAQAVARGIAAALAS